MKEKLIRDYNEYQKLYIKYVIQHKLGEAFQCIDMCECILRLLEHHYGITKDDLTLIECSGLYRYQI